MPTFRNELDQTTGLMTHDVSRLVFAIARHSNSNKCFAKLDILCGDSRPEYFQEDENGDRFVACLKFISDAADGNPHKRAIQTHFISKTSEHLPGSARNCAIIRTNAVNKGLRAEREDDAHKARIDEWEAVNGETTLRKRQGFFAYHFHRLRRRITSAMKTG